MSTHSNNADSNSADSNSATDSNGNVDLQKTPLHAWHLERGARMGAFAGYDMPIRYEPGTIAEHNHTRTKASLFDVSHMGVATLAASSSNFADVAAALELFVPCDVDAVAPGRQRYTQLLNSEGGIIDDLMISRSADRPNELTIVSNAGRKVAVFAHLREHLPSGVTLTEHPSKSLVAIQGPGAEAALAHIADDSERVTSMKFMDVANVVLAGVSVGVSRSGYSGEDGFELAIDAADVVHVVNALNAQVDIEPAGLGARDTLRLEAGLCLYGNDIDETTSPIEAGLAWSIQKRRRAGLNFAGANRIAAELDQGPAKKLVGLAPQGRQPVREHTKLYASVDGDDVVGFVTSGGFSPTLGRPIACGYVEAQFTEIGMVLHADVRGNRLPVEVSTMPFVPHTYKR